jgi:hypothetical protein
VSLIASGEQGDRYTFPQSVRRKPEHAMHVAMGDCSGFHHRNGGGELPSNLKIITLPACSSEVNGPKKTECLFY